MKREEERELQLGYFERKGRKTLSEFITCIYISRHKRKFNKHFSISFKRLHASSIISFLKIGGRFIRIYEILTTKKKPTFKSLIRGGGSSINKRKGEGSSSKVQFSLCKFKKIVSRKMLHRPAWFVTFS